MSKDKKRRLSLKESFGKALGHAIRPFKKDTPHKKLSLESLHIKNIAFGLDKDPYDFDPFPDLTKALEKGGWEEGLRHIKNKTRKRRKST